MEGEKNQLDQLTEEIRKVIGENRKFLDRIREDDFETEDWEEDPPEVEL